MWLALLVAAALVLTACKGPSGQERAQVAEGAAIYARDCQSCHGEAATAEGGTGGAPAHGPRGHTWHHADGQLMEIVLGRLSYSGRTMPSFEGKLTEEQVLAVLAYFKTTWEADQLAFQAEVSRNWEETRR